MSSIEDTGLKSATSPSTTIEQVDKTCVVCFKIVDIFSIGECDHPVCYECSSRMRVLCQQNECPICRRINQKVIYTSEILPYQELDKKNRSCLYNKAYRISFMSQREYNALQRLLEHPCSKCSKEPFPTAIALKEHLRKEHELFYCDLCTENLKLFSFERKAYSREQLAQHRRKGDPDNTSHRGHPLCEYCDERYLDRDELFRHLRRDHFFCHFCDIDGTGTNQFYADHESLRDHFLTRHYLCDEGECKTNIFTASFRSDIDLRAHKASAHGQTSRQARTINFDFNLTPRSVQGSRGARYDNNNSIDQESVNPPMRQPVIDARNEQDFPSLGNGPVLTLRQNAPINGRIYGAKNLAKTNTNFPALGGLSIADGPSNSNTQLNNNNSRSKAASALFKPQIQKTTTAFKPKVTQPPPPPKPEENIRKSAADFPSLSKATPSITSGFPSNNQLSIAKVITKPAVLDKISNAKQNSKISKPPAAKPVSTKSPFDFPSLPSGSGNPLGVLKATPRPQPPVQQQQQQQQKKVVNGTLNTKPKPNRSVPDNFSTTTSASNNNNHSRRDIDEDFIETTPTFSMASVSAKHRALIPSYESIGQGGSKIKTVQQVETTKAINNKNVPQMNSKESFPALGKSTAPASQWFKNGPVKVTRGKTK